MEEKKALAMAWAAVLFFLCRKDERGGVGVSLRMQEKNECSLSGVWVMHGGGRDHGHFDWMKDTCSSSP